MALDPRELQMLIAQAQIKLIGASASGIKAELFDVFKEFFEDSNSWREDIPFRPLAGESNYPIAPGEDGQIIRLVAVWDPNGYPVQAFMNDFAVVQLQNPPQNDGTADLTARVIKTVTLPITREAVPIVPEWVLRVYSIHIMDGLLGRMMGQQDKSYTSATGSSYHLKRFRTGIQIARTAANRANLVGAQEGWTFPRGWRSNSQHAMTSTAFPTRFF